MAKTNLASMSVDALLRLRDEIGAVLSRKAVELKQQLSLLGSETPDRRTRKGTRGPRKGGKVAPKYRGPGGETWSGRGLRPRWLTAALKKGHKIDEFLIDRGSRRKPARRKKAS